MTTSRMDGPPVPISATDAGSHRTPDPLAVAATIRGLVLPAQRRYVEQLMPSVAHVVGYHVGWLDENGNDAIGRAGKSVRPVIAVLAARAAGLRETVAVRAAVAVEMVHHFSLLHDDVIDGDRERRHRPAAWTVFGTPAAILTGDALLAGSVQLIAEIGGGHGRRATELLVATVQELVRGQSLDVAFERRRSVTPDEYSDMVHGKTASLLSCAACLGPVLAGAPDSVTGGFAAFGSHLGMAFQLVDDLLGIWGDPANTGKPVLADVHRRKKSAPVLAALNSGESGARRLAELYDRPHALDADEAGEAAHLIEQCGGRHWAEAQAARHTESALARLRSVGADPEQLTTLAALTSHFLRRDR